MGLRRDIASFEEFWPVYLGEHTCPRCRVVHYIGTLIGVSLVVVAVIWGPWWLALAAPFAGYACAWFGHFVFERNKPATWVYPWWSFRAEWKMVFLAFTGRLSAQLPTDGSD